MSEKLNTLAPQKAEGPKTLTEEEAEKLLCQLMHIRPNCSRPRVANRNYCLGLLMLDAGLRVGELVKLTTSDLWFQDQPVTALCINPEIAKNKRQRIIPLTIRIQAEIRQMYERWWSPIDPAFSYYAFYTRTSDSHITERQVERIINNAGRLSIGRSVYPHQLRHTFATRLMRRTSARIVQQLLGHSCLSSTQIYTHPNADDLKTAINTLN